MSRKKQAPPTEEKKRIYRAEALAKKQREISKRNKAYWEDPRWAKVSHYRKFYPAKATDLVLEIRIDHGIKGTRNHTVC